MKLERESTTPFLNADNESKIEPDETVAEMSGFSRRNWIGKLGNYSPCKHQVSSSPSRMNATRALEKDSIGDNCEPRNGTLTCRESYGSSETTQEMPDLESIIREFEMGFLSPTKEEDPDVDAAKRSNFVKKIVAAFEVKYKTYNDLKVAREATENQGREDMKRESVTMKVVKRRSAMFGNLSSNSYEESKENGKAPTGKFGIVWTPSNNNSEDSKGKGKPLEIADNKVGDGVDVLEETVNGEKSCILSSPGAKSEDSRSFRTSSSHFDPISFSDTRIIDSVDLDVTIPVPDEGIFVEVNGFRKTSTMIGELPPTETVKNETRQVSFADKTPKIVGAFLKKPIEVEDTSIDWIPITGKRLPRKRSLKKLLASFTGKKLLEKKGKLYSSEKNLNEEQRELHDSGYDERSCSSSSLTSLISITEVLLHQENSYVEPERRTTLSTFRSRNSLNEDEDETFHNSTISTTRGPGGKKLLLTEVPREELKLDLGPAYPQPSKILTMSLDRKPIGKKGSSPAPARFRLPKIPKHPCHASIPKHPFVSVTNMDVVRNPCVSESSVIVKNDLYEVEFRRSSVDLNSVADSCRSSSSTGSSYDIPRTFLSKSETEIAKACRALTSRDSAETVYDVPRAACDYQRPRSSVYEDAISLKRRSFGTMNSGWICPDFRGLPNYTDSPRRYATIDSRIGRIYHGGDLQNPNDPIYDLPITNKNIPSF
ncbi:uncharacterized protein LOC128880801 [Hylaeus volcanicus]|uniref:uncharacterized protein LOC128880801 n=1 Tax=Hylaeus volcanicus TaxID=313075 RepID=UPI0023B7EE07|nr:uncharacterized protein LOC128880801 [Hylaeus volcanicus]